jgi:hypothetical protein
LATTGARDGTAQIWFAPAPPLAGSAEQLQHWVEGLTGLALDEPGAVRPLGESDLEGRRRLLKVEEGPPPAKPDAPGTEHQQADLSDTRRRAAAQVAAGEWDRAADLFAQAIERSPVLWRGVLYRDLIRSEPVLERVARSRPDDIPLRWLVGITFF